MRDTSLWYIQAEKRKEYGPAILKALYFHGEKTRLELALHFKVMTGSVTSPVKELLNLRLIQETAQHKNPGPKAKLAWKLGLTEHGRRIVEEMKAPKPDGATVAA